MRKVASFITAFMISILLPGCAMKGVSLFSSPPPKWVFAVIDVSDPHKPQLLTTVEIERKPRYFSICGERIAMTGDEGVQLFRIGADGSVRGVAEFPLRRISGNAVLNGDYLFVPAKNELVVIGLKDLKEKARMKVGDSPIVDMDLSGEYLYLLGRSVFHILSIRNPTSPKPIASLPITTWTSQFATASIENGIDRVKLMKALRNSDSFLPSNCLYTTLLLMRDQVSYRARWGWRITFSKDYFIRWHGGIRRIELKSPESERWDRIDLDAAYTKYLYLSGRKKLKGRDIGEVTMAYGYGGKVMFFALDKWGETVDVIRAPFNSIADIAVSGDTAYLLTEPKLLFILDLSRGDMLSLLTLPDKFKRIVATGGRIILF